MRDELILAIAAILGAGSFLYSHYRSFLDSASAGVDSLRDELATKRSSPAMRERVEKMLELMGENRTRFATAAASLLPLVAETLDARAAEQLSTGLADREILALDRFRFLVAALITWAVSRLPASEPARAARPDPTSV